MNAFVLKIIALISMLIDHLGAVIPEVFGFAPHDVNVFRVIGRVAFPIFVYLVADGFRRTQNPGWFLLRLGLFAVISAFLATYEREDAYDKKPTAELRPKFIA
jgi:hypothetical protein